MVKSSTFSTRSRIAVLLVWVLISATRISANEPFLVKDINPSKTVSAWNAGIDKVTVVDNVAYFVAVTKAWEEELWRTDGTTDGTYLIKDINIGDDGSFPTKPLPIDGTILFTAFTDELGRELWKTDGTESNTVLVKDIDPGDDFIEFRSFHSLGQHALFTRQPESLPKELWRSDGTATGTVRIKTFAPEEQVYHITEAAILASDIILAITDGIHGTELWSMDAATSEIQLLKEINPEGAGGVHGFFPWKDQIYFSANDGNGYDLWKTDGTASGTVKAHLTTAPVVKDPFRFSDDKFLIGSYESLWATDGTPDGTELLAHGRFGKFAIANNVAYMTKSAAVGGVQLWRTDGTAQGSWMLTDSAAGGPAGFEDLVANGQEIFFVADDRIHGKELWKTDGTALGTIMVEDINTLTGPSYNPIPQSSNIENLTSVNGVLIFTASSDGKKTEVWRSDGTAEGTFPIKDMFGHSDSSAIQEYKAVDDLLYFSGGDSGYGNIELWTSNGTNASTRMVMDSGPGGSSPSEITKVGSYVYFIATVNGNRTIFRTPARSRTTELAGGTALDSDVKHLTPLTDAVVFSGSLREPYRKGLWRIANNESAPTELVSFPINSQVSDIIIHDNRAFAFVSESGGTFGLWCTDGTPAGTRMIQHFSEPIWIPLRAHSISSGLIFATGSYELGTKLWISDGISSGSKLLTHLEHDDTNSMPMSFAYYNGLLYFSGYDSHGWEVWRTDGTPEGTHMAVDVNPIGWSDPSSYEVLDDKLYFAADHVNFGRELWVTDGTANGTAIVADIVQGPASFNPWGLEAVDGRLYFSADDRVHGREPWISDGTAEGTHLLADISPQQYYSEPGPFTACGEYIYFTATEQNDTSDLSGRELWAIRRGSQTTAADDWQLFE